MKFVFLVTLGLILTITNVNSSAVDVNQKLKQFNEDDNRTTFTNLNIDCMYLVLEQLDFSDLLNMAQTNQEFSSLAANVFLCKYSHLQIIIIPFFALPNNPNELLNVAGMKIDSDTIRRVNNGVWHFLNDTARSVTEINFLNGDQILHTFKHFGHAIKKFKVSSSDHISTVRSEFIGKLINKFSYESLVDVVIEQNAEMLLDHIKKPLINVKSVTFKDNAMAFFDHTININRLFPSMRRLIVDSFYDHNLIYFDYHLPHLEHFSILRIFNKWSTDSALSLIAKNPQIQSFDLEYPTSEFIEKVNTLLPQMQTLRYYSPRRPLDRSIQFKNVTTLLLRGGTPPVNMYYPRLQNLRINCDERGFEEYRAFLNEHRHISHLHLIHSVEDDSFIHRMIENLPNLVELTLEKMNGDRPFYSAGIVEFLRSHDSVAEFNLISFTEQQKLELREQLQHEWNVQIFDSFDEWNVRVDDKAYRFERKTVTQF